MEPFASVADYRARYPDDETSDEVLYEALLEATDLIAGEMDGSGIDCSDPSGRLAYRLMRVCRSVTRRAIGDGAASDIPFGATRLGEAADTFNASVELANPYGDMFLTQAERDALGIGGGSAVVISPYG